MYLVVYDPGEKMFPLAIDLIHIFTDMDSGCNFFNPAFLYQYIGNIYFPLIYDRYIFKKILLHILKLNNKTPMQIIKSFLQLTLFVFPALSFAQSTYLMQGSAE